MKTPSKASKGFTLIELMVTIALAAILMLVAIPSFTSFQRNAELTATANTLLSGVNAARGEAMKRGRYAMVVPNDGVNWSSGWIVFVDMDRSGTHNSGDIDILSTLQLPSYLVVNNVGNTTAASLYIMYDASGYSKLTTGAFGAWTFEITRNDVSGAELLAQTRRLKIASTGRARVCTPQTSTDTNCLASIAN